MDVTLVTTIELLEREFVIELQEEVTQLKVPVRYRVLEFGIIQFAVADAEIKILEIDLPEDQPKSTGIAAK